jgi:type IV pilus assembly protein PilM
MELPKFYGVDIGKNTIKIVQVDHKDGKLILQKFFSVQTGKGNIASDDLMQRADLAVRIKDAINGSGMETAKAVVALPEPSVFNRLLTFPALDEAQLSEAIHWNAKQFIPIPVDETQMDYIKTAEFEVEGKKMIQILLVAAPKKLIEKTVSLFSEAEQELIAIETEAVATSRIIAHAYPNEPSVLVVDIGAAGTDLSVVANSKLIFSQSLGTGSQAMTQSIANAFGIDESQAEQYKLKAGFDGTQAEGKVAAALDPVLSIITTEVAKTINFFSSKYQQSTPQKVLLVGEGSKLPGLVKVMASKIGLPTELANLLTNLEVAGTIQSQATTENLLGFAVALGLALKEN